MDTQSDSDQGSSNVVVNINQDIPGYEDDYFRCVIIFWSLSLGWIELIITLCVAGSTFLSGMSAVGIGDSSVNRKLSIATAILGATSTVFIVFRNHALRVIKERRAMLRTILNDYYNQ